MESEIIQSIPHKVTEILSAEKTQRSRPLDTREGTRHSIPHGGLLQKMHFHPVPDMLYGKYRESSDPCFLGYLPELEHVWMAIGSRVYFWGHSSKKIQEYNDIERPIIGVSAVAPKSTVFSEKVKHVLVFATPDTLHLAGAYRDTDGALVFHSTPFVFSSEDTTVEAVCSTPTGRVFFGGTDGNIYELVYRNKKSMWSGQTETINHTKSMSSYILPGFVSRLRADPVEQLVFDATRNTLYALTKQKIILFYLGESGESFGEVCAVTRREVLLAGGGSDDRVRWIGAVSREESEQTGLVVFLESGGKMCFSVGRGVYSTVPSTLALINVIPSGDELSERDRPPLSSFFYRGNVFIGGGSVSEHESTLLCVVSETRNGGVVDSYMTEKVEGRVIAIHEVEERESRGSQGKDTGKLYMFVPRRRFVVLTSSGVYVHGTVRAVDELAGLLSSVLRGEKERAELDGLCNECGPKEMCAMLLHLSVSDDVLESIRVFSEELLFRYSGQPANIVRSASRLDTVGSVQMSPFHDGVLLYFARTLGALWDSPVTSIGAMDEDRITAVCRVMGKMKMFAKKHALFSERKGKVFWPKEKNPFEKEKTAEEYTAKEFCHNVEQHSLHALRQAITFSSELLVFLAILRDYSLLEEGVRLQSKLAGLSDVFFSTLLLSSLSQPKEAFRELSSGLVKKQIELGGSTDTLSGVLAAQCPSFFGESEQQLYKGLDLLSSAETMAAERSRHSTAQSALSCFLSATPSIKPHMLEEISQKLSALCFYQGAIALCLKTAQSIDPENAAILLYRRGFTEKDPFFSVVSEKRRCYKTVLWLLGEMQRLSRTNEKLPESLETRTWHHLLAACYSQCVVSDDEMLHLLFYDWLLQNGLTQTLIDIDSPFIESFFADLFREHRRDGQDLLWKYYRRCGRTKEAADTLFHAAVSRTRQLAMSERAEYLARAVGLLRALAKDSETEKKIETMKELLVVSNIQSELLSEVEAAEKRDALSGGILSLSVLFNDFAVPLRLHELSLKIIKHSSTRETGTANVIWKEMVEEERAGPEQLARRIVSVGKKMLGSKNVFDLSFLVLFLGRKAVADAFPDGWLVATLSSAGVSVGELIGELSRQAEQRSSFWHTAPGSMALIGNIKACAGFVDQKPAACGERKELEKLVQTVERTLPRHAGNVFSFELQKIRKKIQSVRGFSSR
ncbi:MAG: nuclear pore complex protein Nup155 [Amphiamblys sp. WSBS2006]|nr:MAG: nuclear pore complex protein Nup155 [Amphiamblys sp. WSBS2006]